MKTFPVTTSIIGNKHPQTTKHVWSIAIAQYMRTWNFPKSLKKQKTARCWWLTPVILATREAEMSITI
jgi:hypothetical protein